MISIDHGNVLRAYHKRSLLISIILKENLNYIISLLKRYFVRKKDLSGLPIDNYLPLYNIKLILCL